MRRRQVILVAVMGALGWSVARGLRWGTAVMNVRLRDPGLQRLVTSQSGLIAPESELKWDGVEPSPGRFDFSTPDPLLAVTRDHGLAMRGHTLLWHEQLPAWVKAHPAAELDKALTTYIRTVVGHYRGTLPSWDVLNEPIADDGTGLRRNLWLERLEPDSIASALNLSHQADPAAALVINAYGLEGDDAKTARKRRTFLALLRQRRDRGVPLHAVGLQAHLYANGSGPTTFRTLPAFLRELAAAIQERDRAVAAVYGAFLAAVLPEPGLKLMTSWGLSARTTWLNAFNPRADGLPQRPLPFDEDNQPKRATAAILAALSKP